MHGYSCMAACKNEQQDYAGGVTWRLYLVCRTYTMLSTFPYKAKSSHSKDHLASGFPMISIDPHWQLLRHYISLPTPEGATGGEFGFEVALVSTCGR